MKLTYKMYFVYLLHILHWTVIFISKHDERLDSRETSVNILFVKIVNSL
jgi:hypothetical protein